jgi:hypothetical protein
MEPRDPDAEYCGYEPTYTVFDHLSECALRAAHAAAGAQEILLQVLLDQQKPLDEEAVRRQVQEAERLLRQARKWVRRSRERPGADGPRRDPVRDPASA